MRRICHFNGGDSENNDDNDDADLRIDKVSLPSSYIHTSMVLSYS